jgi:hypothetical protein
MNANEHCFIPSQRLTINMQAKDYIQLVTPVTFAGDILGLCWFKFLRHMDLVNIVSMTETN